MTGGIELGGTKTVVAIGDGDGALLEEVRLPTTTPADTLAQAAIWLQGHGAPATVGIGAFGPVEVHPDAPRHGQMLSTPKDGWSGADLLATLRSALPGTTFSLDTDVNAALLAEISLGAARGHRNAAYLTVGTGIGAGFLVEGQLLHGSLHPEFGHLKVPRHPDDPLPGLCPYHRDCLEGLASGPALAERWGTPAPQLPPDHPAWEMEAHYLAHGLLAALAFTSPTCVVLGGGISQIPQLHTRVEDQLRTLAARYFPSLEEHQPFVIPPQFGQQAGIRGALLLAAAAP
jgi:fructokinase